MILYLHVTSLRGIPVDDFITNIMTWCVISARIRLNDDKGTKYSFISSFDESATSGARYIWFMQPMDKVRLLAGIRVSLWWSQWWNSSRRSITSLTGPSTLKLRPREIIRRPWEIMSAIRTAVSDILLIVMSFQSARDFRTRSLHQRDSFYTLKSTVVIKKHDYCFTELWYKKRTIVFKFLIVSAYI